MPSVGVNFKFLAFVLNIIAFILLVSSLIEKYKCPVECDLKLDISPFKKTVCKFISLSNFTLRYLVRAPTVKYLF